MRAVNGSNCGGLEEKGNKEASTTVRTGRSHKGQGLA